MAKPLLDWGEAILHFIHHLLLCSAAIPPGQERFRKLRREGKKTPTTSLLHLYYLVKFIDAQQKAIYYGTVTADLHTEKQKWSRTVFLLHFIFVTGFTGNVVISL